MPWLNSVPVRIALLQLLALILGCGGGEANAPTNSQTPDSASPDAATGKTSVKLLLNWFPEAEHGGFYAAAEDGLYAGEHLDVEIIPGGPNVPVIQQVASGQIDFGIANADRIVLGRAQDANVVALLAPLQDSPRCIMVHADSGIESFDDLRDVTLAMSSAPAYSYFLRKVLPLDGVKIVPYPGNIAQFLLDPKFAQQGYSFSEPFLAEREGAATKVLMVSDLGFNPYTSVLICRDELLEEQPELVSAMVRASRAGWQRYLEDPASAHAAILKRNPEMGAAALDFGAEAIRPLCLPNAMPTAELGTMSADRWSELIDQLVRIELLDDAKVAAEDCYSNLTQTAR